jgi:hypothetical protein
MKDQLEDFIRQNKNAFDDKEPSDYNWSKINSELFERVSIWNSLTLWRVAAVLLLGVCVYLALPRFREQQRDVIALNEFKDIESFYISQISEKISLIEDERGREVGLNGFTHDFKQLDAMYQVLKEEMKAHPSQKVKDALVLNLLIRIDLLNKQLQKLEKGSESESDTEVTV